MICKRCGLYCPVAIFDAEDGYCAKCNGTASYCSGCALKRECKCGTQTERKVSGCSGG